MNYFDPSQYTGGNGKKLSKKQARYVIIGIVIILLAMVVFA